jgi:hypothetical protein
VAQFGENQKHPGRLRLCYSHFRPVVLMLGSYSGNKKLPL